MTGGTSASRICEMLEYMIMGGHCSCLTVDFHCLLRSKLDIRSSFLLKACSLSI